MYYQSVACSRRALTRVYNNLNSWHIIDVSQNQLKLSISQRRSDNLTSSYSLQQVVDDLDPIHGVDDPDVVHDVSDPDPVSSEGGGERCLLRVMFTLVQHRHFPCNKNE